MDECFLLTASTLDALHCGEKGHDDGFASVPLFFSVIGSSVLCGLGRNLNRNCKNIDYEMFLNWGVHPDVATFLCFLPVYALKNHHRICIYERAV